MLTSCACVCAGCAGGGAAKPASISIAERLSHVTADDGYALTTYQLVQTGDKAPPPRALMFYIQGVGDQTAHSQVESMAGAVNMNIEVVLSERRGVVSNGGIDADTFNQFDTRARRVADMRSVMDDSLRTNGAALPVILMGEGEGGAVAAAVAAVDPRVTHLILVAAGGGWTQAREMEHFINKQGDYQGINSLDQLGAEFDRIKADPDAMTVWLNHSYRHWSSCLWSPTTNDLQKTNVPVFIVHGDRDEVVPVESARALVADLQKHGKTNITYREYHDVTHAMIDRVTKASIRPLLEMDLLEWFRKTGLIDAKELETFRARMKASHPEWFGG